MVQLDYPVQGFAVTKFSVRISIHQEITSENEKNATFFRFLNSLEAAIISVTSSTHTRAFLKAY